MEIKNLEQKLLVWGIGFQAEQLIEKLKSLPGQDYFKLDELEVGKKPKMIRRVMKRGGRKRLKRTSR